MVRRVGRHLCWKCHAGEIEIISARLQVGDGLHRAVQFLMAAGGVSVGRPKSAAETRKKWRKVDGAPVPAVSVAVFPLATNRPSPLLSILVSPSRNTSVDP